MDKTKDLMTTFTERGIYKVLQDGSEVRVPFGTRERKLREKESVDAEPFLVEVGTLLRRLKDTKNDLHYVCSRLKGMGVDIDVKSSTNGFVHVDGRSLTDERRSIIATAFDVPSGTGDFDDEHGIVDAREEVQTIPSS